MHEMGFLKLSEKQMLITDSSSSQIMDHSKIFKI